MKAGRLILAAAVAGRASLDCSLMKKLVSRVSEICSERTFLGDHPENSVPGNLQPVQPSLEFIFR